MKAPPPKTLLVVAGLLVAGYLLYRHSSTPAAAYSGAPSPSGNAATSGQQSGSDQGSASATADLLSALGAENTQLLAALKTSSSSFASYATAGSPAASVQAAAANSAAPAPAAEAPPLPTSIYTSEPIVSLPDAPSVSTSTPWSQPAVVAGGQTNATLPPGLQVPGLAPDAYVIGGPSQVAAPNVFGDPATPFTSTTTAVSPPLLAAGAAPRPGKVYAE